MGAPERAHYAKKSEIVRETEVTSMEYVRRRQKPLGNRAAENYPCTSVYRLRGIKPAKDWTVYRGPLPNGRTYPKYAAATFENGGALSSESRFSFRARPDTHG